MKTSIPNFFIPKVGAIKYNQPVAPVSEADAGLSSSSGEHLPIKSVTVRGKIVDMVSSVVVYQEYYNPKSVPIEAKFIWPLSELSAIVGFEVFINDKKITSKAKEKQQAQSEYLGAVEQQQGAYLVEQESPSVFSTSVGNIPAKVEKKKIPKN